MTHPELIEEVARAIWEGGSTPPVPWKKLRQHEQDEWRGSAKAVLARLNTKVLLPEYRRWRGTEEVGALGAMANLVALFTGGKPPAQPQGHYSMVFVPVSEAAHQASERQAWLHVLEICLEHLGEFERLLSEVPEVDRARWLVERNEIVKILRDICRDFGDNEWQDDAHLADVLEKHLYKHLSPPDNPVAL